MRATKQRKRNGRTPEYNPDPKDDEVLWANMGRLMKKYPGQYVIVAGGEIFVGRDGAKLQREADRKHPDITAVGCPIPRKKDLFCIL